ncbi:5-carboxymethyl uridine and 5-carboxymethyl 2-thiouridine methyltransferase [Acidisarcina polymorpha]|uniref:5-carboxymethyl uridine and 5-carboxymethyl 2-thiouridine methyltransferase n=2 Tax=Acidisarcina polymorpha TaxID=2211140 RepID=A0A2Z5G312_9BACT|nr:5-carboxymethyl uridine and 5-carboxymethyl 2-thiouridine methyltransferase [Acidisarcina polymorpha]
MHLHEDDEHSFALRYMLSILSSWGIRSILDIGSGTGRGLLETIKEQPEVFVIGVEPSAELRAIGHSKGLSKTQLIDGDAQMLAFKDRSFDLVCEFGALHHIPDPHRAVAEMLRVARKAIFISDSNNFGQGSKLSRTLKQVINAAGLWPFVNTIRTKGKGYFLSEEDGVGYSYSVFNNYRQIRDACESVHMLNTASGGPNLYRTAAHVALLGRKREDVEPPVKQ